MKAGMPVIRLHPSNRQLGTHVLLGRAGEPFPFRVVGPGYRVLTLHRSLEAACARARWHAGTRFVYVEFAGANDGACWDGLLGRLVEWDQALKAMGEGSAIRAAQYGEPRPLPSCAVIPFRKCRA